MATIRDLVVVEPTDDGTTGEVTIDVVGFPDDSIGGVRLRVTGEAVQGAGSPDPGSAYKLVAVEATGLCLRGVDGELCV